ncbi:hypothetical protein A0O36_02768 [Piscirickettsiaceae bacterium NZ-RLO1]|nr:hypothetical protein A0O36_02768 [Piscirickettsiaceae bacterium NZ-RLO1]
MTKRNRFKKNQPFKWKHYSGDIILWLVRWYGRYALSYRDLKEMAAERGLELERSTTSEAPNGFNGVKSHFSRAKDFIKRRKSEQ